MAAANLVVNIAAQIALAKDAQKTIVELMKSCKRMDDA